MHGEDAYLFRHAIMRDAAYQLQLPGKRASLHALAFDILEDLARREGAAALDRWAEELADHAGRGAESEDADSSRLKAAEADYLFRAADYLRRSHEHARSMAVMHRLLQHGSTTPLRRMQVKNQLGVALRALGRIEEARVWAGQGLDAAVELGRPRDELVARGNLANLFSDLGNHAEAVTRCRDVVARAEELQDFEGKARALVNLAANLQLMGEHEQAIAVARQGLEVARAHGNKLTEGNALKTLGDASEALDRSADAEACYLSAREVLEGCGAKLLLASCWNNLGVLYWNSNRGPQAKEAYGRALKLYAEAGVKRSMGYALVNLALFCLGAGETEQAQAYAVSALNSFREVGAAKEEKRWLAEWNSRINGLAGLAPLQ
ncbi:hypothetical protein EDM80_10695 [bacterium]|nr:MAG: hypothetical protein EDM80_10695 [bacterium]RIK63774.1 MAG: hypothetical protein DCC64_06580 [Planctomycetota bacterium]